MRRPHKPDARSQYMAELGRRHRLLSELEQLATTMTARSASRGAEAPSGSHAAGPHDAVRAGASSEPSPFDAGQSPHALGADLARPTAGPGSCGPWSDSACINYFDRHVAGREDQEIDRE
jgi:hypothetical protein